ncbi:MAG: hypothetical protein ABJE95_05485 [Byssovorax sp.]
MRLAWGVVAALALSGCGPSPEAIERARVLVAIDRLRDAPAGEIRNRRELVADLAQTVAVVPDVIRARDTCVAAYRALLDGTELQNGVRAELVKGDASPALAARLLEAESRIKQSQIVMPDCERAATDLRLPSKH